MGLERLGLGLGIGLGRARVRVKVRELRGYGVDQLCVYSLSMRM